MEDIETLFGAVAEPDADLWGDETVLRPLMDDILRYFVRRVPSRDIAADGLSEVMLVLWRRRSALPRRLDELRAFSFGVARRIHLGMERERARAAARHDAAAGTLPQVPSHTETTDLQLDVERLLSELKPAERELLLLTVWERLTLAEAATVMGISAATARQRHSRIIRRLAASTAMFS